MPNIAKVVCSDNLCFNYKMVEFSSCDTTGYVKVSLKVALAEVQGSVPFVQTFGWQSLLWFA